MSDDRPNILVIWGDDIGITNLSCYSDGLMGYRTPNIDRIADEGMRFTDSYGEQSCTAGRSSFITGQSVFRTGLSKVGVPAAPIGLQAEDPTIAGWTSRSPRGTPQHRVWMRRYRGEQHVIRACPTPSARSSTSCRRSRRRTSVGSAPGSSARTVPPSGHDAQDRNRAAER